MTVQIALFLSGITLLVGGLLAWRMHRSPFLARIGARNILRRGARTTLIVFGLMLATTLVTAAITINNTLGQAVKTVAVAQIGPVDEEITNGQAGLGDFPAATADAVTGLAGKNAHIAGIAPALLVESTLVVDASARQAHGDIFTLGLATGAAGPLADLQNTAGGVAPIAALAVNELYLNPSAAQFLHATTGDVVYLYSPNWPGNRFQFTVRALVSAGPLGKRPTAIIALAKLQTMVNAPATSINRIYIANTGNDLASVDDSDGVVHAVRPLLPAWFHIRTIKKDAIAFALQAQDLFSRVVALYILFTLAIDLLLIFLVFTLLVAERRTELGTVRALGMYRGDMVELLIFEGAIYDLLAALPGAAAGIGLGLLLIGLINPASAHFGFPLQVLIDPVSVVSALCLGLLFSLGAIILAVWVTGRLTIAAALRGQPEPPAPAPPVLLVLRRALGLGHRRITSVHGALAAWGLLLWNLTWRGIIPLVASLLILRANLGPRHPVWFTLGLICAFCGLMLIARWLALSFRISVIRHRQTETALLGIARATHTIDRLSALAFGAICLLYWLLPLDVLRFFKLSRFAGGINVFFLAGVLLVVSTVFAATLNLDALLAPWRSWLTRTGRWRHVIYIGVIYPTAQRWRTGLGLAMFSLVCFTMVVMSCIAASTSQRYGSVPDLSGGYDIIGRPLFAPVGGIPAVTTAIQRNAPADANAFAAVSSARALPLGVIQPDAPNAGWRLYPVSEIQGSFLQGAGLPLVARAPGYTTDAAVWQALRDNPGMVVMDSGALSAEDAATLGVKRAPAVTLEDFAAPPIASTLLGPTTLETVLNRPDTQELLKKTTPEVQALLSDPNQLHAYTLQLNQVVTPDGQFAPQKLWLGDFRGGGARQVTVIGLVDNAQGQRYGILGSPDTFAPLESAQPALGNDYYFFQLKPGGNAHAIARDIGSALLDNGFETTVIQEALLDLNAPRVYASQVLVGLVGLLLLIGVAALMVTGSRSVVERRQQIGMLRALGFRRTHVQGVFLLEALIVAFGGAVIGLTLGVLLCRNAFDAGIFENFDLGLALVVPWTELLIICATAVGAALVAAIIPAWQASRIAPAEALRYE